MITVFVQFDEHRDITGVWSTSEEPVQVIVEDLKDETLTEFQSKYQDPNEMQSYVRDAAEDYAAYRIDIPSAPGFLPLGGLSNSNFEEYDI